MPSRQSELLNVFFSAFPANRLKIGYRIQLTQITRKIDLNKEIISRLSQAENDTEFNKELN